MQCGNAGVAQLVERNLAKVEVASSSLVSRSNFQGKPVCGFPFCLMVDSKLWLPEQKFCRANLMAGWQSGYAAACKAVYMGSIPVPASS